MGHQRIGKAVGTFGIGEGNTNRKRLIEVCIYNNLRIMNTFFRHRSEYKVTWSVREHTLLVDYIIVNEKTVKEFLDDQSYWRADIGFDQYLVQGIFRLLKPKKRKDRGIQKRINIRALDEKTTKWLYQRRQNIVEENISIGQTVKEEWSNIKSTMKTATSESLGMIRCKITSRI